MPDTQPQIALETLFETPPNEWEQSVQYALATYTIDQAKAWAIEKFEWLATQGVITYNQLALAKDYVEWTSLKDLLAFKAGYHSSLSEIFHN